MLTLRFQKRTYIGIALLFVSLAVLSWSAWSFQRVIKFSDVAAASQVFDSGELAPGLAYDIAELMNHLNIKIEAPGYFRVGDSEILRVNLEEDTPLPTGNLYQMNNVLVEARFEINGLDIVPAGEIYEPLQPGKSAVFFWSLRSLKAAEHQGMIWLHLRLIPLDGSPERRYPVRAQIVRFRSADLFGLSGRMARVTGGVGFVVGAVLALEACLPWLERKLHRFEQTENEGV